MNKIKKQFETQKLELKRSLSLQKEGLKSLCGMINTDEAFGQLVFGISPELDIIGIGDDNIDNIQIKIAQTIQTKFDPNIIPDIQIIEYNELKLLSIKASRSIETAYHEFDGRAFIREGSRTRVLNISEKEILVKRRNRENHNGPWKCNKCGAIAMNLVSVEITDKGIKKTFKHNCGGEYWPI